MAQTIGNQSDTRLLFSCGVNFASNHA